jgi:hypothetical protein
MRVAIVRVSPTTFVCLAPTVGSVAFCLNVILRSSSLAAATGSEATSSRTDLRPSSMKPNLPIADGDADLCIWYQSFSDRGYE